MILEEIAQKTRERIEAKKKEIPLESLKEECEKLEISMDFPFEKALKGKGEIHFICEVKKASPSKGIIAQDFPYVKIAKEYEEAKASAISVLTEPFYFKGKNEYVTEIVREVGIPVLRKDFTVDEYMIYEAKLLGASAILLICSILTKEQLEAYLKLAHSLGLSALVETHNKEEVEMAIACKARIIGVNNRNLKDFTVDIENSLRLRKLVPKDIIFISESGMKTPEDIQKLKENGTNGVLIGETFMRSTDKKEMLQRLRGE